jgi:hypothetical protein
MIRRGALTLQPPDDGCAKIVNKINFLAIFTLLLLFQIPGQSGSCRGDHMSNTPAKNIDRVETGVWGGHHIQMQVTESGALIEYDCAHGTIEEPLVLDGEGRFEATGTHVRERGGPVREGDKPDSHPARYAGRVNGKTMTLSVTLTDTRQSLDMYTLTQGDSGRIMKCL